MIDSEQLAMALVHTGQVVRLLDDTEAVGPAADFYRYLLTHGELHRSAPGAETGEPGQCFRNCGEQVLNRDTDLRYVEGYAIRRTFEGTSTGFACHHAWLADDDGVVTDPTWGTGHSYFGVPFDAECYVSSILEHGHWAALYYNVSNGADFQEPSS